MSAGPRLKVWIEIAIVAGAGTVALVVAHSGGLGSRIEQWLVPSFFLYVPVIACLATDRDFNAIGLSWPDKKNAGLDLAIYVLLILPVFLFLWWVLARYWQGMRFQVAFPGNLAGIIMWHVLGVALPEEVFFRGWLQGRLSKVLGNKWKVPGATVGPGLFIAAAAFAGGHYLAVPSPYKLVVFFPGMLFGYYRERSNSVVAPVLAHAAGNITFIILQTWAVR